MSEPSRHPAAPYGQCLTIGPLLRQVLAPNPSAFTHTGTQTHIVGHGTVAIIDPGPDDPAHTEAIMAAVAGETVSHYCITHSHADHSPAARTLQKHLGGEIVGGAAIRAADGGTGAEAGFDTAYAPDRLLTDGEQISGPGWTLQAVATPGHTSNHFCFALAEEQTLFTGDHVMGWATTVIVPPDGDMAAYLESLAKLLRRDDHCYRPTHGPAIEEPQRFVRGLIAHRRQREGQILALLAAQTMDVGALVAAMYQGTSPKLWPAAGQSVLAHLLDLQGRGLVQQLNGGWART